MLMSIIIPVYNGEKYIKECLDSIFRHSSPELEVIVVNDGSKDKSSQIIQEYNSKYSNLVYIEQENSGVSKSRNNGLKAASGRYIMFVDADDIVEDGAIDKIIEVLKNNEKELYVTNYYEITENNDKERIFDIADKVDNSIDKFNEYLITGYLLNACWGKIFRKDIIENNNIKFDTSLAIGEDIDFIIQYLKNIKEAASIKYPAYRYRQIETGAVRSNRSKLDEKNIRDFSRLLEIKNEYAIYIHVPQNIYSKLTNENYGKISAAINLMIKDKYTLKQKIKMADNFISDKNVYSALETCIKDKNINKKRRIISIVFKYKPLRHIYVGAKHLIYRGE